MIKQFCKVGRVVPKNLDKICPKGNKEICNPVPVIGYPSETCADCNKSN